MIDNAAEKTGGTHSTLHCSFHPNIETSLRCNRCEKSICSKCAIRTPTGYRCPDCVRGQQRTFDTSNIYDYPISFALASVLAFLGSLIASRLSFFTILIAPMAGTFIAEVVRFAVARRRSKRLSQVATAATLIGCLPMLFSSLLLLLAGESGIFGLFWQGLFAFMVTSSVYYRLGGVVFRR